MVVGKPPGDSHALFKTGSAGAYEKSANLNRRSDRIAVNDGGYGPLEQIERNNDPKRFFRSLHDKTPHPRERPAVDPNSLTGLKIGPWHQPGSGRDEFPNVVQFLSIDGRGPVAHSKNLFDAGRL